MFKYYQHVSAAPFKYALIDGRFFYPPITSQDLVDQSRAFEVLMLMLP